MRLFKWLTEDRFTIYLGTACLMVLMFVATATLFGLGNDDLTSEHNDCVWMKEPFPHCEYPKE